MSELDSKTSIPLYPYFVIDEVLYTLEKTKATSRNNDGSTTTSEIIMIKGGTLTPFVINKKELDSYDPNRKILLEILKKYYQLPETLSDLETLKHVVKNSSIKSHSQLRTLVLLSYNTDIVKSMETPKSYIEYIKVMSGGNTNSNQKYIFIIILIIILVIVIGYFLMRKK
jgi:hypothetical protein